MRKNTFVTRYVDFIVEHCIEEALYSWLTHTVAEWPIKPPQGGHMLWVISSEKTRLLDDEPTLQYSPRGRYKRPRSPLIKTRGFFKGALKNNKVLRDICRTKA